MKKYKSDLLASIHETMKALHDAGLIDPQTMREFNNACLDDQHDGDVEEDANRKALKSQPTNPDS